LCLYINKQNDGNTMIIIFWTVIVQYFFYYAYIWVIFKLFTVPAFKSLLRLLRGSINKEYTVINFLDPILHKLTKPISHYD